MLVDHHGFQQTTRRLIIRPVAQADYARWVEANDALLPSQSRFDPGRRPPREMTREKFDELVEAARSRWAEDRFYRMSIFLREGGELVGLVTVIPHIRLAMQTAAVGVVIHNTHWRRGYASEALEEVVHFGFTSLDFHRLTAEVETDNVPSIKTFEKAGFRKEGTAQRFVYDGATWRDVHVFALTAEERGVETMAPRVRTGLSEA